MLTAKVSSTLRCDMSRDILLIKSTGAEIRCDVNIFRIFFSPWLTITQMHYITSSWYPCHVVYQLRLHISLRFSAAGTVSQNFPTAQPVSLTRITQRWKGKNTNVTCCILYEIFFHKISKIRIGNNYKNFSIIPIDAKKFNVLFLFLYFLPLYT